MSHHEDIKAVKDLSHEPASSDEYHTYGITDDFAWYELTAMKNTLQQLASRFENMERTLKSRSVDQGQYVNYLENKIRMLKELAPQDAKE
jgi:hypothetical protein